MWGLMCFLFVVWRVDVCVGIAGEGRVWGRIMFRGPACVSEGVCVCATHLTRRGAQRGGGGRGRRRR